MMKRYRRFLAITTAIALVFAGSALLTPNSLAANLTSLSDSLETYVVSTDSNHTISFTLATALSADNSTIEVTFQAGFDLATNSVVEDDIDISGSTTGEMTTAADCSATEEVGVGISGQTITFTLCNGDGGSLASSETVTIEIGDNATASGTGANKIVNPGSSGSYTVSITTKDSGATTVDTGSIAVPILSDEQVSVSGTVDPNLSFVIRNSADSADTNTCGLGTLSTGSTSTCAYRLAIETNASSGFTASLAAGGGLVSGSDQIDDIAEDGTVTAGTEGYGIQVTGATSGSAGGGGVTEAGVFNDDDTPVPTSATNIVTNSEPFDYTSGNTATSTLVTHVAAIAAVTPAGSYTQTITYTVTGNF